MNENSDRLDKALIFGAWFSGATLVISVLVALYFVVLSPHSPSLSPQERIQVKSAMTRLKINPADTTAAIELADIYAGNGDTARARQVLESALHRQDRTTGSKTSLLLALGMLSRDEKDHASAERYFLKVIGAKGRGEMKAVDRYLAIAHYEVAVIQAKRGNCGAAVTHFRDSVNISPAEADAQYRLGRCLLRLGRTRAAIASLSSAVRLDPDFLEARDQLSAAYDRLSREESRPKNEKR